MSPTRMPYTVQASEVEWTATRGHGPGGQHVNKVSSAVHLRFDIRRSSLPEAVKQRLLERADQRLTADGVIVIKSRESRSQDDNWAEAMRRLQEIVDEAAHEPVPRKATKPTYGSRQRRLQSKAIRSRVKALRGGAMD